MVKTRVIRLRVIEGSNACDQIAFCAFHTFLVKSKRMLASYMRRMRINNLEIRIAGSSCCPQLNLTSVGTRSTSPDSETPWVRKNGNQEIREIFVITWPSERLPLHVSRCQMLHLLLAVPPGLLERKINNKAESFFLFSLYFDVYTDMDNRKRDSAGRTSTGKFYRSGEREDEKC